MCLSSIFKKKNMHLAIQHFGVLFCFLGSNVLLGCALDLVWGCIGRISGRGERGIKLRSW